MFDPSDFTHPYARPGTFLYSERGAAPVPGTDRASVTFTNTDIGAVTVPVADDGTIAFDIPASTESLGVAYHVPDTGTRAITILRDRYTGVPAAEYARTPGRHAAEYTPHARTFDTIWVTLFGTSAGHPRHARRDG